MTWQPSNCEITEHIYSVLSTNPGWNAIVLKIQVSSSEVSLIEKLLHSLSDKPTAFCMIIQYYTDRHSRMCILLQIHRLSSIWMSWSPQAAFIQPTNKVFTSEWKHFRYVDRFRVSAEIPHHPLHLLFSFLLLSGGESTERTDARGDIKHVA